MSINLDKERNSIFYEGRTFEQWKARTQAFAEAILICRDRQNAIKKKGGFIYGTDIQGIDAVIPDLQKAYDHSSEIINKIILDTSK